MHYERRMVKKQLGAELVISKEKKRHYEAIITNTEKSAVDDRRK